MRRNILIHVAAAVAALSATLSGCASQSDRFGAARMDPVVWWLSGAPQPYELNWPRSYPPDLPVLNPVDYQPIPPPWPLDYPRGWNPNWPPYAPTGADVAPPVSDDSAPACGAGCESTAPELPHAAASLDARADARDGERIRQR